MHPARSKQGRNKIDRPMVASWTSNVPSASDSSPASAIPTSRFIVRVVTISGHIAWGPQMVDSGLRIATLRAQVAETLRLPNVSLQLLFAHRVLALADTLASSGVCSSATLTLVVSHAHCEMGKILQRFEEALKCAQEAGKGAEEPEKFNVPVMIRTILSEADAQTQIARIAQKCNSPLNEDTRIWLEIMMTMPSRLGPQDEPARGQSSNLCIGYGESDLLDHQQGLLYFGYQPDYDDITFLFVDLQGALGELGSVWKGAAEKLHDMGYLPLVDDWRGALDGAEAGDADCFYCSTPLCISRSLADFFDSGIANLEYVWL